MTREGKVVEKLEFWGGVTDGWSLIIYFFNIELYFDILRLRFTHITYKVGLDPYIIHFPSLPQCLSNKHLLFFQQSLTGFLSHKQGLEWYISYKRI